MTEIPDEVEESYYNLIDPIYNWLLDYFNRGKHAGRSLDEVSRLDPDYILFLCSGANLNNEEEIAGFREHVEDNPGLFDEVFLMVRRKLMNDTLGR